MGHCSRNPGAERRRFFELKRYVRADRVLRRRSERTALGCLHRGARENDSYVIADHISDRPGHFRAAHSSGHRTGPAPSRGALTMREETMSGTWHWPKLKSKPGIRSRPRTTTSTPNIISGRCPVDWFKSAPKGSRHQRML